MLSPDIYPEPSGSVGDLYKVLKGVVSSIEASLVKVKKGTKRRDHKLRRRRKKKKHRSQ